MPSKVKRAKPKAVRAAGPQHVSHGSVFDDLSPKKAASLKLKAELHSKIVARAQGYSQQELQHILSETQSRVSQLMNGKIAGFTLDVLIFYAECLGIRAEIRTKQMKAPEHPPLAMADAR